MPAVNMDNSTVELLPPLLCIQESWFLSSLWDVGHIEMKPHFKHLDDAGWVTEFSHLINRSIVSYSMEDVDNVDKELR